MNPIVKATYTYLQEETLYDFTTIEDELTGRDFEHVFVYGKENEGTDFDFQDELSNLTQADRDELATLILGIAKADFERSPLLTPEYEQSLLDDLKNDVDISPRIEELHATQTLNPFVESVIDQIKANGLKDVMSLSNEMDILHEDFSLQGLEQADFDRLVRNFRTVNDNDRATFNQAVKDQIQATYNYDLVNDEYFQKAIDEVLTKGKPLAPWVDFMEETKTIPMDPAFMASCVQQLEFGEPLPDGSTLRRQNEQCRSIAKLAKALPERQMERAGRDR